MLQVTEAAVEQLNELLENADAGESQGIRLVQNEAGVALQIDLPQEGDQVVAAGDRPVLLIGPELSTALDGATLDTVETPEGNQLKLVDVAPPGADGPSKNGAHES
ncbi:MAG: hypothetical protein WD942_00435 [Dehalococcoidia bacterium]